MSYLLEKIPALPMDFWKLLLPSMEISFHLGIETLNDRFVTTNESCTPGKELPIYLTLNYILLRYIFKALVCCNQWLFSIVEQRWPQALWFLCFLLPRFWCHSKTYFFPCIFKGMISKNRKWNVLNDFWDPVQELYWIMRWIVFIPTAVYCGSVNVVSNSMCYSI